MSREPVWCFWPFGGGVVFWRAPEHKHYYSKAFKVALWGNAWDAGDTMKIDAEAVQKRIEQAKTLRELDQIAEVAYAVADLALQETEQLIEETQKSLGQRAVDAGKHGVFPQHR